MTATTARPLPPPAAPGLRAVYPAPVEFRCVHCSRYLGRWVNGVLHEPGGDRSGLPVVRKCPTCGKGNRRLTAPD